MNSVFDSDRIIIFHKVKVYGILSVLMVIFLIVGLLLVKKDHIYENNLYFSALDRACLFTNKETLAILKKKKKIFVDKVEYDFIIEKIEKKDNLYLVNISFPIELKTQEEKYQIVLGKESILEFIIRIVKGE